jgi:hypothetical protein
VRQGRYWQGSRACVRLRHVPQILLCRPHVVRSIRASPTAEPLFATFLQIKSYWKRLAETPPPSFQCTLPQASRRLRSKSRTFFLFLCPPLPNAVRCNDARLSCPASVVCADDGRDAFGLIKRVASDGSIVDAVINVDPFEVAETRDFGEFQPITYAVDC